MKATQKMAKFVQCYKIPLQVTENKSYLLLFKNMSCHFCSGHYEAGLQRFITKKYLLLKFDGAGILADTLNN